MTFIQSCKDDSKMSYTKMYIQNNMILVGNSLSLKKRCQMALFDFDDRSQRSSIISDLSYADVGIIYSESEDLAKRIIRKVLSAHGGIWHIHIGSIGNIPRLYISKDGPISTSFSFDIHELTEEMEMCRRIMRQ